MEPFHSTWPIVGISQTLRQLDTLPTCPVGGRDVIQWGSGLSRKTQESEAGQDHSTVLHHDPRRGRGNPGVMSPATCLLCCGVAVLRAWPEYSTHAPGLPGLLIPTDIDKCEAERHGRIPPCRVWQRPAHANLYSQGPDQSGCGEPGVALTYNLAQCSFCLFSIQTQ